MMLGVVVPHLKILILLLTFLALPVLSIPKGNRATGNKAASSSGNRNTKITTASDGSMILDKTVMIKYVI